jgi:transcriptional regulator GlxA family with amidase domain
VKEDNMQIAILLFDDITALDAVGPYEVLARFPGAQLKLVGERRGRVQSDGGLGLHVDLTLDELRATDLLLVPGGFGARKRQHDAALLAWLREVDQSTRLTASVCTGAFLLAAAGLLRGRTATTHWAFLQDLTAFGVTPVQQRVVRDGKYATAAGVSAGIDLGLMLALELHGRDVAEAIQLSIEYDPAPPLSAGHPDRVAPALRERLYRRSHARDAEVTALQR